MKLRVFGGLWLENDGEAAPLAVGRAVQRRRLALLALVAVSPNRRLTRDKVLAILWPDARSDEGRRRLSTALYDLRQALGNHVIESAGDELVIADPWHLSTDFEEFAQAAAAADWETVIKVYGGPFLDGVHVGGSVEFEEWISEHRQQTRRTYVQALERGLASHRASGNREGAVAAALHLMEEEPASGHCALLAVESLAAEDHRSEALQVAEQYVRRVRAEFGAEPDAAVLQLVARIRRSAREQTDATAPDRPASPVATSIEHSSIAAMAPVRPTRVGARRRLAMFGMTVGVAAVLLNLASSARQVSSLRELTRDGLPRVAVMPFRVSGTPVDATVRDFTELLGASLEETGAVVTAVGTARAARVVSGQLAISGRVVRATASMLDARTGAAIAESEADGSIDSLPLITGRLSRQLVAGALETSGRLLEGAAARSTESLGALRAFLAGERDFHDGRYDAAATSFQTAVARDSEFALAHYRLSLSMLWGNRAVGLLSVHESLAVKYAARLPGDERSLIQAYSFWRHGDADAAEALYRAIVARQPRDAEAWQQLGETEFHYNPTRGRPIGRARDSYDYVVNIDPSNWGALWHLTLLDAGTMSGDELRSRIARLVALDPDGNAALEMKLVAAETGPELSRLADTANDHVLFDAAWRRAVFRRDLAGAESLFLRMTTATIPPAQQRKGASAAGALRLGQGRVRAALPLLVRERPARVDEEGLVILVHAMLAANSTAGAGDVEALSNDVERWRQGEGQGMDGFVERTNETEDVAAYLSGLLAVQRGDNAAALRIADQVERAPKSGATRAPREFAETIRGFAAFRARSYDAALAHLDRSASYQWMGWAASSPLTAQSFERFIRAECLRGLGRHREAIAWYATFDEYTVYDLAYLGLSIRARMESYDALGEQRAAQSAKARLTELWQDADAEFRVPTEHADVRRRP